MMNASVPNPLATAILISWRRNAAYGQRLIADIDPALFLAQPMPARTLNHPAWIVSHLNLYAEIAVKLCRAEHFDDPIDHRYGQKSVPLSDPAAYANKDALLAAWTAHHESGEAALQAATTQMTNAPTPLERWRTLHPTTGDMLLALMVKHESGHLGQLSAWRRAMNLPRVAV